MRQPLAVEPPKTDPAVVKTLQELLTYHESLALALHLVITAMTSRRPLSNGGEQALLRALELDNARRKNATTTATPRAKRQASHTNEKQTRAARRAKTAALLAKFSPDTPLPPKGIGRIGTLVANGFLKRKGTGYVRTTKPFAA